MALGPGTRFGSYVVGEAIGAGGMGEVYRATDTTLERDVALKVLPASFAEDADRVTRFEREAKTLASLNHPNIAQIYGLEKSEGTTALVMELVDGATLEERIAKGPIPADEALGIAMQIADALEAAHGQNIVHRDLKPANIKLKADGTIKVLDFGIAKALAPESLTSEPQSPIMTTPATQVGVILGTAAYMSPEQAKGKAIDQRTDIWAFGCVLYEMLTGQLAFGAEDVPTTLARIIANDANLDSLPAATSPAVRKTIEVCLEKDVRKRVADIRDVKLGLGGLFGSSDVRADQSVPSSRSGLRFAVPMAAAVIAAIAGTTLVNWTLSEPDPRPVNRFDYDLPLGGGFRNTGRPVIDVAPDGRSFILNTTSGILLREMDQLEARLLPGTQPPATSPTFSTDGSEVVYWDTNDRSLKRIPVSGGAAVEIAGSLGNVFGLSWTPDGEILFGQLDGVYRVAASGGTPERIIPTEDRLMIYGARQLPDGDSVVFSIGPRDEWDLADIVVQSLETGERTTLVRGGYDARYVPTGHIVYALGDGLFAVSFDLQSLTVSGSAVPLVQGVMRASGINTGAANYAVSDDGTLVYVSGSSALSPRTLVWVDRQGVEVPVDMPVHDYVYAQISPDGTRAAVGSLDQEADTWIWDFERETLQRLTFDASVSIGAVWSQDGQRVAFGHSVNGIAEVFWQAADGSGTPEPLTQGSADHVRPTDILDDDTAVLYMLAGRASDIWLVSTMDPETAPTAVIATPADERSAVVSPDGRWIAYQSDESGEDQIYVRPFPDVDAGRWQVSTDGGESPTWSDDGSELFYVDLSSEPGSAGANMTVMAVPVSPGETFTPGTPIALFSGDYKLPNPRGQFFDVSADGQRFLMIKEVAGVSGTERPQIVIVQNWFEELKRLAPVQ